MQFRSIIIGLSSLLLAMPAAAMEKPYRVSLVGDGYDGKAWHTGLRVELADGWKTYWRMPGEAGIPPEFTWKTSVPASVEVFYPVPGRHADASGETVGYEHEVIFPVRVEAGTASEVSLSLDLFFAVCKDICIPAQAKASVDLGSMMRDPRGTALVEDWRKAVPRPGSAVMNAEIATEDGKPALQLKLAEGVDDIFVETDTSAYFRKPRFSADGRQATLAIDNVSEPAKLRGKTLMLTYRIGTMGLEQAVTLP